MMRFTVAVTVVVTVTLVGRAADAPLTLVTSMVLPRVEGRIDHLAFDVATQRLYVAALGNNTVEVLDVKAGTHLRSLPGFHEPQGIAVAADAKVVAVANGEGEGIQLLTADDNRSRAAVKLGDDSDNVRYEAEAKRLYVGFGSGALAAIDPAAAKTLGQVELAGHPESFQLERSGTRVFVNVPTVNQIAVIDRTAMTVIATWPVTTAKSNFPMALDEANHRLFVGCRLPSKLIVLDTDSGAVVAKIDISSDADDLFYDAKRHRIYAVCGEGKVDIIDQTDADTYKILAKIDTAGGARTGFFIPAQNELLVAVPRHGSQGAQIRVYDIE